MKSVQTNPATSNRLVVLGLRVEELTSAEVARATTIRRQRVGLSVPDTFAFAIAEARRWTLLTDDGGLREWGTIERVDMHGVLWLFDCFAEGGHVRLDRLHASLTTIFAHPRCRLAGHEVRKRLVKFGE
jgi:hypothetical protein